MKRKADVAAQFYAGDLDEASLDALVGEGHMALEDLVMAVHWMPKDGVEPPTTRQLIEVMNEQRRRIHQLLDRIVARRVAELPNEIPAAEAS